MDVDTVRVSKLYVLSQIPSRARVQIVLIRQIFTLLSTQITKKKLDIFSTQSQNNLILIS